MTAREFLERYADDVDFDRGLMILGNYLGDMKYAQFPDAELPENFINASDEPADFKEYLEEYLDNN